MLLSLVLFTEFLLLQSTTLVAMGEYKNIKVLELEENPI